MKIEGCIYFQISDAGRLLINFGSLCIGSLAVGMICATEM